MQVCFNQLGSQLLFSNEGLFNVQLVTPSSLPVLAQFIHLHSLSGWCRYWHAGSALRWVSLAIQCISHATPYTRSDPGLFDVQYHPDPVASWTSLALACPSFVAPLRYVSSGSVGSGLSIHRWVIRFCAFGRRRIWPGHPSYESCLGVSVASITSSLRAFGQRWLWPCHPMWGR